MFAAAAEALRRIEIEPPKPDIEPQPMELAFKPLETQGDDLYTHWKTLEERLEFLQIQEDYVKDEMKHLKNELLRAQEEIKRIQSVPLIIGQVRERKRKSLSPTRLSAIKKQLRIIPRTQPHKTTAFLFDKKKRT